MGLYVHLCITALIKGQESKPRLGYPGFELTFDYNCTLGLCYGTSFDTFYAWTGDFSENSDKYIFKGFTNSELTFDKEKSEWHLQNHQHPEYSAKSFNINYPFGTQIWLIYNDTCQYRPNNVKNVQLNFNVCDPKEEFNCADGTW